MELALTLVAPDGRARHVVARWQGPVTVADLVRAAGAGAGGDGDGDGDAVRRAGASTSTSTSASAGAGAGTVRRGRAVLPAGCPLDEAGLRPGDVLRLDGPGTTPSARSVPAPRDPATGWHLAVVGGPDAGGLLALTPGRYVVGRDEPSDLVVNDAEVSRAHLAVEVTGSSVLVEDLRSTNGTYLDGRPVTAPVPLLPGQLVEAGASRLQLVAGSPPDVELSAAPDGCLEVRRPPRLHPPARQVELAWPVPPRKPEGRPIPVLAMLAPVVLGAGLWAFTRNPTSLLFVLLSPVMMVANVLSDRHSGRRRYRRARTAYERERAEAERRLAEASTMEGRWRRQAHPDPGTVLAVAAGPRRRLWERRRDAPDFLVVRLGLARLPSAVRIQGTDAPQPPTVPDVPCTVPLAEAGVLGVVGEPDAVRGVARWVVGQSAVASGPSDLRVVVLCGPDDEPEWGFARWLPHATADRRWPVSGMGTTPETVAARIRELVDLIEQRRRAAEESAFGTRPSWPWVLVTLDRAHALRTLPGVDALLRDGPAVGVVAVCLETAERRLPLECRAVVAADADGRGTLRRTGEATVDDIVVDAPGASWAESVARALAPLRDPEGSAAAGAIPDSVRLVDLLDVDLGDVGVDAARRLAAAWRLSGRSTSVPVGVGGDGPLRLDLVADGPHGLVGGTTGAGKSEFLRTLVASLAIANRPDALAFLLVDYKGEAAFRDCARLPHTVGVVTDLDGHLTERALRSLSAELRRRMEVLRRAGATDLAGYLERGEPEGPMPRLVIVIDEFAELVLDLPDFVAGLVSTARRGRSLGVHLILATQRPSGVVSPEIRANASLKVALRVTAPAESLDIIEAPDAARIEPATPGRAYLRVGSAAPVLFQSAWVGGSAPPPAGAGEPTVTVVEVPWDQVGRQARRREEDARAANPDPDDTDLARLVTAASGAAGLLDLPPVKRPWLPPLPGVLPLGTLDAGSRDEAGVVAAPYALVDLPAEPAQHPLCFDLAADEHLLVVGSPGRGRTTLLRTLAASLVTGNSPADVWLYAVDCGGGELRALARLPHTGAVVIRSETDRADRLLTRLSAEVARRADLLAAGGYATLTELRAATPPADRLPYLVLFVDRWEAFLPTLGTVDNGRLKATVEELAREGGPAGLRLVVTGDRSLLVGELARAVDDRLYLGLADRADLTLGGLRERDMPAQMPPGRAIRHGDRAEVQVALVGDDPSGPGQADALAGVIARSAGALARPSVPAGRPFRVDPLPVRIDLPAARRLPGWNPGRLWALAGVGGDDLAARGVDLAAHDPGFTVVGPRGSGRSTALVVLAESLLAGGNRVLALCPRPSPLRELAGRAGVVAVLTGREPPAGRVVEVLNGTPGPLAVLVDDATDLANTVVGDLLDQQAAEGIEKGHVMVVAGVAEDLRRPGRGFIPAVRQSRTGLLLCPQSHLDGELLGVRLPPSAAFRGPAGRGVLVLDNEATLVQVPVPDSG